MPMKYKSRTDIVATILESASNIPISKTRLMYMSYLSHEKMTSFAAMLIQNDLLSFDNHRRLFSTTAKGLKFLELYNEMQQCVQLEEEQQLLYKKQIGYLQNELKSLGIEPKIKNELNDHEE